MLASNRIDINVNVVSMNRTQTNVLELIPELVHDVVVNKTEQNGFIDTRRKQYQCS